MTPPLRSSCPWHKEAFEMEDLDFCVPDQSTVLGPAAKGTCAFGTALPFKRERNSGGAG